VSQFVMENNLSYLNGFLPTQECQKVMFTF
jgi:hypothetical protein